MLFLFGAGRFVLCCVVVFVGNCVCALSCGLCVVCGDCLVCMCGCVCLCVEFVCVVVVLRCAVVV